MKKITLIICLISSTLCSQTPITDANFHQAINTCLSTNPVDGMCSNSEYGAMPDWDVSQVTNMHNAFKNNEFFNANIESWNVSNVTNMSHMFENTNFNQNISNWDVSKVNTMQGMFDRTPFNQNIGGWNVSLVTDMQGMFWDAPNFNQNISNWDVSNVTDFRSIFDNASSFNQNLSNWCVSNITSEPNRFSFNSALQNNFKPVWGTCPPPISNNPNFSLNSNGLTCECDNASIGEQGTIIINGVQKTFTKRTELQLRNLIASNHNNPQIALTCTSGITNLSGLFNGTFTVDPNVVPFNQDISSWDVSSVTDMSFMFFKTTRFNQDISSWDVSSVSDMNYMFYQASSFNQNIGNWNVSSVNNTNSMYERAASFNQNIGSWDVSNVVSMNSMFLFAREFNQDLTDWCVSNINTEPESFASNSALQNNQKPIWSTCPKEITVPIAHADTATVDAGSINNNINVLVNDEAGIDGFIDGGLTMTNGTLTSASVNEGLISVDNNGTADTNDDVFLYTPKAGFTGEDSFQYTITDASGDASTATVTVIVNAVTNVPNAIADSATTTEDTTVSVAVLNNDNFGSDGAASQNSLSVSGASSKGGVTSVLNNEIMYTPLAGFVGEDSFEYTIEDATGDTATAVVTITVIAKVNGTPTAIADFATFNQNSALNQIAILANDNFGTDGPNASHALTFSNGSTSSASANGGLIALSANGTPSDLTDDVIEYTPAKDFSGADQFEYIITDGNGDATRATVTITVNPSTEVYTPTASDDTVTITANSMNNTIDVLANDESGLDGYIDGGLTMTNGTLTSASIKGSAISIDNKNTADTKDDEFVYTPSALAETDGSDTFSYTITDASGDASTATVTVTIGPAATDVPVALDDTAIVEEDTTVSIDVLDNDNYGDDGAALVDALTVGATSDLGGTTSVVAGEIEYTPALNFVGTDTFEYTIEDGNGDKATATITITVTAEVIVNGTPTATDDFVTVSFESTNTIISVLSNDTFGSDGLNATHPLTLVNGKQSTASLEGGLISVSDNNTPNDASDDVVLYSAPAGFNGADSFEYTITDLNGDASRATVSITVNSAKSSNANTSFSEAVTDSFKIYPNPSNGNISTIFSSKVATEAQMILFDTTGRIVYKSTLKIEMGINQFDFNFEAKAGVLFMKIASNTKNFGVRKLVIK